MVWTKKGRREKMFDHLEFAKPEFLYFLLVIPLLAVWYWYRYKRDHAEIQLSGTASFEENPKSIKQYLYFLLYVFRLIAIGLLIIALARPQTTSSRQDVTIEGIDIVMALDVSGSMLAMDLKPDRLEAAKEVASEFISGRPNDRFGLVIFSGEAFTQCPLTTDHQVIKRMFEDIKSGMIEDGTAIGDGLATSVNRLKDSKAVSKVIILLTDGVNNMGSLDPLSSAEIAKIYGVRIYTIGVGTMGLAPYPVQTPFGMDIRDMEVKIDEELLQQVAELTNGRYFRATSNQKLREIYQEIDKLEKSKIDVTEFQKKKEEFFLFALVAFLLITMEILLRFTVFRSTP
jgi:Ca-activated chloride channel family protein